MSSPFVFRDFPSVKAKRATMQIIWDDLPTIIDIPSPARNKNCDVVYQKSHRADDNETRELGKGGILEISRIDNTVSLKKGGEDPPPQEWEVKGIRAERGVQKGSRSRAGEQDEQNITGGIRDNSTKTDGKDGFKGDSEHPIPQERRLQKILRESWSIGWYITKGPNSLEMPPCGLPSTGLLKDGDVYLHHVLEQKGDHKGYLQTWTYDGGWQRIEVGHRRWLKGAIREFKV